jgi:hypothetical protein
MWQVREELAEVREELSQMRQLMEGFQPVAESMRKAQNVMANAMNWAAEEWSAYLRVTTEVHRRQHEEEASWRKEAREEEGRWGAAVEPERESEEVRAAEDEAPVAGGSGLSAEEKEQVSERSGGADADAEGNGEGSETMKE